MDDDWDEPGAATIPMGGIQEGGCKFSAGRGFKPVERSVGDENWGSSGGNDGGWNDNDDGWKENGNQDGFSNDNDGGWGGNDNERNDDFGRRGGRGGGRGGQGGRGGRGGGRGSGGRFGDRNGDDGESGGGFRGGRGGRFGDRNGDDEGGGFRGGRGGRFGDRDGDDEGGGFRGGRGGGRGGRGRGGGRGSGGDDWGGENKENGEAEKKREIYIPPERITEDDLFTSGITTGINFMKLDDIKVNISGEDPPAPITSFETSGLRKHLLENVKKSGYTKPTPIQKYAIPTVLNGRDLMGCAQTGSGKTAAFLLPIINKLMELQEPAVTDGTTAAPYVIVISPTRELAIQINDEARKFAKDSIVKVVVAYGGTAVNHQRARVANGCHILVATPGRLNDFVQRGTVSFASVKFIVLDEADRMLDTGFMPVVEKMLGMESMPATGERQTLMFSATFPQEIQDLAGKFLHNYIFIAVGIVGSASKDVEQQFYQVSKFDKRQKLLDMLKESSGERTLVFVETKRSADFLATFLSENDIQSTSIHGDRLQSEREQALWDFKKGIRMILVATGVAARGLDIKDVQHVINYDLPKSIDEYVHRIGRTGRVGNKGRATSFYDESQDRQLAGNLAQILRQAGQEVPDFLSGSFGDADFGDDQFGGRDIRGSDFGRAQDFHQNPVEEAEEEW